MSKIKKTIDLPVEIIKIVEDYKEKNFLPNFTAALVQIILEVSKKK